MASCFRTASAPPPQPEIAARPPDAIYTLFDKSLLTDCAVFPPSGAPSKVSLPTIVAISAIIGNRVYGIENGRLPLVRIYEVGK